MPGSLPKFHPGSIVMWVKPRCVASVGEREQPSLVQEFARPQSRSPVIDAVATLPAHFVPLRGFPCGPDISAIRGRICQ
jgi:hypothetical protein